MTEPTDDVMVEDRYLCVWVPVGTGWAMAGDRRHHIFDWSEIEDRGPFAVFERRTQ